MLKLVRNTLATYGTLIDGEIILVALRPNATHLYQPMDVAVFRTLKDGWRESVLEWRHKNSDQKLGLSDFSPLLQKTITKRVTPEVRMS